MFDLMIFARQSGEWGPPPLNQRPGQLLGLKRLFQAGMRPRLFAGVIDGCKKGITLYSAYNDAHKGDNRNMTSITKGLTALALITFASCASSQEPIVFHFGTPTNATATGADNQSPEYTMPPLPSPDPIVPDDPMARSLYKQMLKRVMADSGLPAVATPATLEPRTPVRQEQLNHNVKVTLNRLNQRLQDVKWIYRKADSILAQVKAAREKLLKLDTVKDRQQIHALLARLDSYQATVDSFMQTAVFRLADTLLMRTQADDLPPGQANRLQSLVARLGYGNEHAGALMMTHSLGLSREG